MWRVEGNPRGPRRPGARGVVLGAFRDGRGRVRSSKGVAAQDTEEGRLAQTKRPGVKAEKRAELYRGLGSRGRAAAAGSRLLLGDDVVNLHGGSRAPPVASWWRR